MGANGAGQSRSDEEMRLKVATSIVSIFLPERIAYLTLSGLTAVLVIWQSWQILNSPDMLHDSSIRTTALATLLGSGGVVAFNLARLLTMFNSVLLKVFGPDAPAPRNNDGH